MSVKPSAVVGTEEVAGVMVSPLKGTIKNRDSRNLFRFPISVVDTVEAPLLLTKHPTLKFVLSGSILSLLKLTVCIGCAVRCGAARVVSSVFTSDMIIIDAAARENPDV